MIRFFSLLLLTALSLTLSAGNGIIPLKNEATGINTCSDHLMLLPKRKATVTAGTIIFFEMTSSLNSREVTVGTMVPFRVTTHVMAEKHVVVSTGTQALGRVKKITKATFNSPEVIEIEVKHVQAIDGSQIPLSTNPVRIKGTFPGQGVEVEAYTTATSMVMNDTEVELK